MTRAAFFSIVLIALLPAIASATPVSSRLFTTVPADPAGVNAGRALATPSRSDTVWFGGDDGTGQAYPGGVWDWEGETGDPLQGWRERDLTEDWIDCFYRVTADSFTAHGDPCVPIFPPAPGQTQNMAEIWCGIHQDEAIAHDFINGMGYGNHQSQQALSPRLDVAAGSTIDLDFRYFNDAEEDFDYTRVNLNCYDAGEVLLDTHGVAEFTGTIGSPESPALWSRTIPYTALPAGTARVELEFRFDADGGWSDEDGYFDSACGPFAADDVVITIGGTPQAYDFEDGTQGWTFRRVPGIGAFMASYPEAVWRPWLESVGVGPGCWLEGNALGFCTPDVPYPLPGFPDMHHVYVYSGVVDRGSFQPPDYNSVCVRMAGYFFLKSSACTSVRAGWSYYPYTTEVNPLPHWSPRGGPELWGHSGDMPYCAHANGLAYFDLSQPPDGDPIPPHWEKMRFIFEIQTENTSDWPPYHCTSLGETNGSPLIDLVQVGLTHRPDAPSIACDAGMLFHDGFGQTRPEYLDPGDVGDANVSFNLAHDDALANDWHADTSVVNGPIVNSNYPHRWLSRFCVKVGRKGPRQDMIPGYVAWRQRLAYAGDPEQEFVCVQMDSVETATGVYRHRFATYFHDDEPGYDPAHADYSRWQEILPDSLWSPGTRLEYRYEARWIDGSEWFELGPYELEILPGMRLQPGEPYAVQWPCVLYLDAFNAGAEKYIVPALEQLGLEFDRYDLLDASASWYSPLRRSYGGTSFNPGGWGNTGCTLDQLIGYRLVLLDTGTLGTGTMDPQDFYLLADWLAATDCGLADTRRGIVLSGDAIAEIIEDAAPELLAGLGVTLDGEFTSDGPCVWLEPPSPPVVALRAPHGGRWDRLGVHPDAPGAVGTLSYRDYAWPPDQHADFARVVRQRMEAGVCNWRSVTHGFALHEVSAVDWGGEPCSPDSAALVAGIVTLVGPEIGWIAAGGAPFTAWRYPCEDTGVGEDDETHLRGPVDYLYPARPNPNRGTATIRFRLAKPGEATLRVFDPAGRCVRTLANGPFPAGEQSLVWDGTNDRGHRLGAGIFWLRLSTAGGYASSLRLLRLE
jgi:hypothetical protein